ncbi:MAG: hypothetical protein LBJ67_09810 [Planctomycetaceae bacterium]|jgi:hypothetical protein|nr:hypothetical protein [Planctomycetaceae bacterium]
MCPHSDSQKSDQSEMFRRRLVDFIDEHHELAYLVDWDMFDRQYDSYCQRAKNH